MGKVVYNIFFHPLRSFPGPITHAASRIPYCIYLCTGRHPFHVHSLHARYGPVVRIAPDELAISGAGTAWKDIMYAPASPPCPQSHLPFERARLTSSPQGPPTRRCRVPEELALLQPRAGGRAKRHRVGAAPCPTASPTRACACRSR